jgi:hypothetical protein
MTLDIQKPEIIPSMEAEGEIDGVLVVTLIGEHHLLWIAYTSMCGRYGRFSPAAEPCVVPISSVLVLRHVASLL